MDEKKFFKIQFEDLKNQFFKIFNILKYNIDLIIIFINHFLFKN